MVFVEKLVDYWIKVQVYDNILMGDQGSYFISI